MGKQNKKKALNDKQAIRKHATHQFDHEFANEPLTHEEHLNNKKTKKRQ